MANKSQILMENSQAEYAMHALTDSGDHLKFTSTATRISTDDDVAASILVNGVLTGGIGIAAISGSDDVVDIPALTCNLNGLVTIVSGATDEAITRPATAVSKINSITVNSSGAIAVIAGADGSTTAFSEARGAAGSAPYIPVDSIELFQVRVISSTSAAITSAEIFKNVGQHRESAFPVPILNTFDATVNFKEALALIHTGDTAKGVYAQYADVNFAALSNVKDWVPSSESISVGSEEYYDGDVVVSEARSVSGASFNVSLNDGITDDVIQSEGKSRMFKFFPDKNKAAFQLVQGSYSAVVANPTDKNPTAAITIAATQKAVNFIS